MTLVLGCLTPEFVVLTSDRRITRTDDAGHKLFHVDSDLKSFLIGKDYLVGYCGVARFNNQPMQLWVTDLLHPIDPAEKLRVLREAVAATVWSEGRHREPVAFMGVGFRDNAFGQRAPHRWLWSNALDDSGDFHPEHVAMDFTLVESTVRTNEVSIASIGVEVECAEISGALEGIIAGGRPSADRTASVLGNLQRTVAVRNDAVGPESLRSILTKNGDIANVGGRDDEGIIHAPSISDDNISIWGIEINPNATGLPGPYREKLPPPGQHS